jgi:nicotinamidase-related amidase
MINESGDKQKLITREDCVLVLIDIQDKLIPVITNREGVIKNVVQLARFSHIIGLPVIITQQEKLGFTIAEVKKELPDVRPINKVHFNCFFCKDFKDQIGSIGKKTLILAGVEAHICVAQTALYALPYFNVHVVGDATSSRTVENRDAALERMRQFGVTITSSEMLIYELLQKAGTEEFKAVLQLVK